MSAALRAGAFLLLACAGTVALSDEDEPAAERRFTFSWPFIEGSALSPRGGTSRGPAVTLDRAPSAAWVSLNEAGLDAFERDRRAILAMAGGFRTSFEFIETVGFTPNFEPARPYQSWSTEYVDVLEDNGTEISLQHTIVMEYIDRDGNVQGPIVQKHWRQDWVYEDPTVHVFAGGDTWRERRLSPAEREGAWTQAVFQVDDSPRYESVGRWTHTSGYSSWVGAETWRPLPRRESSVRDDYNVLIGTNRHTITPTGWVHEQENLKAVLGDDYRLRAEQPYLARELGLNRYERIRDFEFAARDPYWRATGGFWRQVRTAWADLYRRSPTFEFSPDAGERPLFMEMFQYAARLEGGADYDTDEARAFIDRTLSQYVTE